MAGIDWVRLFDRGRCKAVGVPWNDAERVAVYTLGIPADYVRLGCLTKEEHTTMLAKEKGDEAKTGKRPLVSLRKEQLYDMCVAKGIIVTPDAVKTTLIDELRNAGVSSSISVEEIPA